jgi:hypothetical protein
LGFGVGLRGWSFFVAIVGAGVPAGAMVAVGMATWVGVGVAVAVGKESWVGVGVAVWVGSGLLAAGG